MLVHVTEGLKEFESRINGVNRALRFPADPLAAHLATRAADADALAPVCITA